MKKIQSILLFCLLAGHVYAEKSALVFYDSSGVEKTVEFGWNGDKTSGKFYISQSLDGTGIKVEDGNLTVDGSITARELYADVDAGNIKGTINGSLIDSISWEKISGRPTSTGTSVLPNTIGSAEIINGSIDSADIASAGIGAYHLRDGAAGGEKIAPNSIDSNKIINGSISGADIGTGTITDANIATISGSKINPDFGANTISTSTGFQLSNTVNNTATLRLLNDAYKSFQIRRGFNVDSSILDIQMDADNTTHYNDALIAAYSDVGILGKLEVIGEWLQVFQNLIVKGTIYADGGIHIADGQTLRCSGTTTCSDMRYKQNVRRLSNSLEKIAHLRGVAFEWDTVSFPGFRLQPGAQIGFIAQEAEKIMPEVVQTDEKGYKSIDYGKISAVLVEAVKEQQNIINSQKSEIDKQGEMIRELNNRLAKLEEMAR